MKTLSTQDATEMMLQVKFTIVQLNRARFLISKHLEGENMDEEMRGFVNHS